MEHKKGIDWSSLWKKEDWVAVWIGFLTIALVLAGLTIKPPKFKWTTEGEFESYRTKVAPSVEELIKTVEEKGDMATKEQAVLLKSAIDAKDRKLIGDGATKLEEAANAIQDEGLKKKTAKLAKDIKGQAGYLTYKIVSSENILWIIYVFAGFLAISIIAMALMGEKVGSFIAGFPLVFILTAVAQFIAGNYTVHYYGVEYVLWCLFIGLFISNVIGVPGWLVPAVRTEYYIKTGLVILGSNILFGEIVKAGAYGLVQAVVVVVSVWYLTFWIARKLAVDDDFAAIISSSVSICGVSAAIATSGAIKGDPKKLSYVTSIVLICAIPMLLLQPYIAKAVGMPDVVAGAWLGGTLDTSGSVVAAGALISETAMKTGVIVKMSQNVLIGVAAFILSIVWTFRKTVSTPGVQKPGLMEIWYRFPKFVLGFLIASIIFSSLVTPPTIEATKDALGGLRTWWFALAFTSIGLETKFTDLAKLGGGKPALAFILGQGFNIIWTLILAYLLFGGILFPAPKL